MSLRAIATVVWLALCAGCGSAGANPAAAGNTPPAAACDGPAPSYQAEVQPLLKQYCVRCHIAGGNAGDEHDFTRFEVLHAQSRAVAGELNAHAMPPAGLPQPTAEQRALIARWACLGAPQN